MIATLLVWLTDMPLNDVRPMDFQLNDVNDNFQALLPGPAGIATEI